MDEGALVNLHQLHLGELDDFGVGQHLSADVSIGTGDECPSLYGPTGPGKWEHSLSMRHSMCWLLSGQVAGPVFLPRKHLCNK